MTSDTTNTVLAAILDGITLIQGQLDACIERQARLEAMHRDIVERLDTIDAGQAAVTDLVPALEVILARVIEDRELNFAGFQKTARIAAFAYSAAAGSPAPLPSDLLNDPLLERYRLEMPADRLSPVRALAKWREEAGKANDEVLAVLLERQYQPSPTETVETAALRYRLAAITREELERRNVALPEPPLVDARADTSEAAKVARIAHLAYLWNVGSAPDLYAEAELAGAVDCLAHVEHNDVVDREAFRALHATIGSRIASGQRIYLRPRDPFGDKHHLGKDRDP